jgi:hypothetical protein
MFSPSSPFLQEAVSSPSNFDKLLFNGSIFSLILEIIISPISDKSDSAISSRNDTIEWRSSSYSCFSYILFLSGK